MQKKKIGKLIQKKIKFHYDVKYAELKFICEDKSGLEIIHFQKSEGSLAPDVQIIVKRAFKINDNYTESNLKPFCTDKYKEFPKTRLAVVVPQSETSSISDDRTRARYFLA